MKARATADDLKLKAASEYALARFTKRLARVLIIPANILPANGRLPRGVTEKQLRALREYAPLARFTKRSAHALIIRANERLRGVTEKEDAERIRKELALKFCGPKIPISTFQSSVNYAVERNDVEFLDLLCH